MSDLGTKIICAGLVDEGIEVERLQAEITRLTSALSIQKPVCPVCQCEMKQQNYKGYYDQFSYWECNCESFPGANTWNGAYV